MSDSTQDNPGGLGVRPVGRRDLLKLGATSAFIPAMIGPSAAIQRAGKPASAKALRDLSAGPFAVGYWSGAPDDAPVNARQLKSGDPALAQSGAVIEMIGMSEGEASRTGSRLQSLAVDILLGATAVRAWRYENTIVRNVSSPNAFTVPVDARSGISFSLNSATSGLSGVPKSGSFRLSTGNEASVPKLCTGYYVVAIGKSGHSLRVDWTGYALTGDSTGQSITLQRNGKPATSFPYLIFSVSSPDKRSNTFV